MKAVQFNFDGSHSIADNVPKPRPSDDEVLVKVVASALDTSQKACVDNELMGYFIHKLTKNEPLYLGYHYSGTVDNVGSNVTDLPIGTAVFGFLQYEPKQSQGAFAEYITVKRSDCAIKPSEISHSLAAAAATEPVTALQAMRDLGGLDATTKTRNKSTNKSILIVGAAGGVGSAAVQIAKQLDENVQVTAVCRTKDVAQVRKWGADYIVDRTKDPSYVKTLLKQGYKFDIIFNVSNSISPAATRLLKPKGALVYTMPNMSTIWSIIKTMFNSKKVTCVACKSNEADLNLVAEWLFVCDLDVPIDSRFKVKDMQSAIVKQNLSWKKNGRVVIQVEGGWE